MTINSEDKTNPDGTYRYRARLSQEQSDALAQRLREAYDDGATIAELKEETGRSFGTVHRLLQQTGSLRPRGGASHRKALDKAAEQA